MTMLEQFQCTSLDARDAVRRCEATADTTDEEKIVAAKHTCSESFDYPKRSRASRMTINVIHYEDVKRHIERKRQAVASTSESQAIAEPPTSEPPTAEPPTEGIAAALVRFAFD